MIILNERSVQAIKNFDAGEINIDNAEEFFKIYYEIEYKYSMLTTRRFNGVERRKDNILRIIEDTGEFVIKEMANSFVEVFGKWLDEHALTDPKRWAEQRFNDETFEDFGIQETLAMFFVEVGRYAPHIPAMELIEQHLVANTLPETRDFINWMLEDEKNMRIEDIKSDIELGGDIEEIADNWGYEAETYEELVSQVENEFEDVENYVMNMGIESLYAFESDEQLAHVLDDYVCPLCVLQEWGEKILFPLWYEHWSARGIDNTRANIERLYNNLMNIDRYSFRKQLGLINQAINSTHQNGSMMEYYGELYDVGPHELQYFSNMDTAEWDEELREIGVQV